MNRMINVLLEVDEALGGKFALILARGFGLFLKQQLLLSTGERALFPREQWPVPRTTEDIDLLLHAEIAVTASRMSELQKALDGLGFEPIESARFYQFSRKENKWTLLAFIR
jgi:hypothetical protein